MTLYLLKCKGIRKTIWNGCKLKLCKSNNWRESLVPAAAVIPAPVAYSNIVVVKTLVVYWRGLSVYLLILDNFEAANVKLYSKLKWNFGEIIAGISLVMRWKEGPWLEYLRE